MARKSYTMTKAKAEAFLKDMVCRLGAGFHPDIPPSEYIDTRTGVPIFAAAEAARLDAKLDAVFGALGTERVYEISNRLVAAAMRCGRKR